MAAQLWKILKHSNDARKREMTKYDRVKEYGIRRDNCFSHVSTKFILDL